MIDPPTPAGYVHDAEEALGKARAMRDQAHKDWDKWSYRAHHLRKYCDAIRAWAAAGGTGPRPRKPPMPE